MNRQGFVTGALRRLGAARRNTQPQKPPADGAATTEFLYVPCTCDNGGAGETRRWVQEVPIVRKTARLIYYTSDSWDRREAVVSPGCISREQFDADTRGRKEGLRRHGYPAGVIPIPGHLRTEAAGRLFFATREAAERALRDGERERAGRQAGLKELRRVMADAHPDRGGTADQFIQARGRYQSALKQAGRVAA